MQNTKILVIGRTGQVGWELRHKLACMGQVTAIDFPEIDLTKPDSVRAAVRAANPQVIVNAAAYTAVDKAEAEEELATAINGTAPGVIAEEALKLGSVVVHYSTDYVFDGTKQAPYVETDTPNPMNIYGKTKLLGDRAIEAVGGDYLILRTSWVYGPRGNNFLLTMLRLARERTELRIVDDQIGAPTSSECIAQATSNILAQVLAPSGGGLQGRSGVYNLTSWGETSWFGFTQSLLSKASVVSGIAVPSLIPIRSDEFPRSAQRPSNSCLSCGSIKENFGVALPHWEYALSLVLDTLHEGVALEYSSSSRK